MQLFRVCCTLALTAIWLQQLLLELQEEAGNLCLATRNALLHQQNQHLQENLESKEQMIEHLKHEVSHNFCC